MCLLFDLVVVGKHFFASPEKQGNTPETCDGNYGKDDTTDERVGTAEEPGNNVKLKKSYATPIDRSDHDQKQSQSVQHKYHPT